MRGNKHEKNRVNYGGNKFNMTNDKKYITDFQFKSFCVSIFKNLGYKVKQDVEVGELNKKNVGMIITDKYGRNVIVDAKIYRTITINNSMLDKAILNLISISKLIEANNFVLIVFAQISQDVKEYYKYKFGVTIIDSSNIRFLISYNENLLRSYRSFSNDIPHQDQLFDIFEPIDLDDLFENKFNYNFYNNSCNYVQDDIKNGLSLISKLDDIQTEIQETSIYEEVCLEILQYLFSENLHGWHNQYKSEDELSRYDTVCRILNGNKFWEFLKNDFNTRYIIFDYKSKSSKLNQDPIYIAEKSMHKTALRNVCIMISQKGPNENAIKATHEILKDTGKLIIHLTTEDLKEMINLKVSGSEPTEYLFDLLDSFLLTMPK